MCPQWSLVPVIGTFSVDSPGSEPNLDINILRYHLFICHTFSVVINECNGNCEAVRVAKLTLIVEKVLLGHVRQVDVSLRNEVV